MTSATIDELCEFVLDGTHGSPVRTEGGIPVLSAQNVKGGGLDFSTSRFTTAEEFNSFQRRLSIAAGDVLLTIVGTVGRTAVVEHVRPLVFQRSVAVLRPRAEMVTPRFLFHAIQSAAFQAQLASATNQSSQAGVYLAKLKKLRVPLLPIDQQRRIASILDQADALRAKRRAALAHLDALARSIFLEMFGDPATNPKAWDVRSFDEAIRDETARSEKLQRSLYSKEGAFPVVDQGQQFVAGFGDDETLLCASELPVVVFGDHTRAVKLVRFPFIIGADGAKVLVPQPGVRAVYLAHLLKLLPLPDLGYSRHMREVKRLVFPVPPLSLQQEFETRLEAIEGMVTVCRSSAKEFDVLFTALQSRAFQAEV